MKRIFKTVCISLAFLFLLGNPSNREKQAGIQVKAEEVSTETENTVSQIEMFATYYEWEGNYATINDGEETTNLVVEDIDGNVIEHRFESDKLSSSIYGDDENEQAIVNYYDFDEYGNLLSLDNNNQAYYELEYNDGDLVSASHNGHTQFWNVYDDSGNLIRKTYSNSDVIEYTYDNSNRLTSIIYDGEVAYTFSYIDDETTGECLSVTRTNNLNSTGTEYRYQDGDLIIIFDELGSAYYDYSDGAVYQKYYEFFSQPHSIMYSNQTVNIDSSRVDYSYDTNNRLVGKNITTDLGFQILSSTTYATYDSRPTRVEINNNWYDYSYDNNYNLLTSYSSFNNTWNRYTYTASNQLQSERINENEYIYSYDNRGNIISKTWNGQELIDVEYDDDDRLIYKSEEDISYDSVGNPLNYNGWDLTWNNGRNLTNIYSHESEILAFEYDDNGFRTSKSTPWDTTYYIYDNGNVIYEKNDDYLIYYLYGTDNDLIGFTLEQDGEAATYYYLKDGLNNIIALVNSNGGIVTSYTYDAYGNILSIEGSEASTVGQINPYRYRSYRYDVETGFYYLNSRYYDPEIGRFINADDISMLSNYAVKENYNLYSYAYNNPVKYADPDGNAALVIGGITISVGAIIILSAGIAIAFFSVFFPAEFNQVCNVSYSAIVDFFNACKSRATTLWEKLTKSGRINVHHIVAKGAKRAQPARDVLKRHDIKPLTDSRNLVPLKERFHQKLHTRLYYDSVNAVIKKNEDTKEDVCHALLVLKILLSAINVVQ